ncbi:hypothetical protein RJT34_06185 [Clitoria ternatea]|uniref:Uncharacterized protein n=1 Tax=Clitoria ternatea TaxID=43366 RepID=A0AAN9K3V6_CLITE
MEDIPSGLSSMPEVAQEHNSVEEKDAEQSPQVKETYLKSNTQDGKVIEETMKDAKDNFGPSMIVKKLAKRQLKTASHSILLYLMLMKCKRRERGRILKTYDFSFCALVETHAGSEKAKKLAKHCNFDGLAVIEAQCSPYTWARGNLYQRLDRGLCNLAWRCQYQDAIVHHLPKPKFGTRRSLVAFCFIKDSFKKIGRDTKTVENWSAFEPFPSKSPEFSSVGISGNSGTLRNIDSFPPLLNRQGNSESTTDDK